MTAPSNIEIYLRVHDGNLCRVTGYGDAVDKAHIVPDMESQWFDWNYMSRYIHNHLLEEGETLLDIRNLILLRSDVHRVFDGQILAFVPKSAGQAADSSEPTALPSLVTHFLGPTSALHRLYHNITLHELSDVCPEFLFARFAWSLFPLLTNFLSTRSTRALGM